MDNNPYFPEVHLLDENEDYLLPNEEEVSSEEEEDYLVFNGGILRRRKMMHMKEQRMGTTGEESEPSNAAAGFLDHRLLLPGLPRSCATEQG